MNDLWARLMTKRLGYQRFGAHRGDWGSTVTEQLARSHPDSVVAIHLTDVPFGHLFQKPSDPSPVETRFFKDNEQWMQKEGAYALIQSTKPQSLAQGLNDSPAGLAAWIVEKFQRSTVDCDVSWRAFRGDGRAGIARRGYPIMVSGVSLTDSRGAFWQKSPAWYGNVSNSLKRFRRIVDQVRMLDTTFRYKLGSHVRRK